MNESVALREAAPLTPAERARRVLVVSQSVFFASLGACLVIKHGPVARVDGISFYGVYPPTMPLLFTGYLTAAAGLWRVGALAVDAGESPTLRLALGVVAVGLVVLLATPYNQGTFLNWTHMSVGVTMALVQLGVTYTVMTRAPSPRTIGAFGVVLAGGIVAAASLPDWDFRYLLHGEVAFEVGFGWCLFETLAALAPRRAAA